MAIHVMAIHALRVVCHARQGQTLDYNKVSQSPRSFKDVILQLANSLTLRPNHTKYIRDICKFEYLATHVQSFVPRLRRDFHRPEFAGRKYQ